MGAEVDSIEIQVETEAKGANRSLSNMERKLTRIAERLTEVSALASGLGNVGNFDIKGIVSANSQLGTMLENIGNVGKRPAKPRIDRSDIKYATKDLDTLFDKFQKVGTGLDVSKMQLPELQKALTNAEKESTRLYEKLNKKLAIENVERYGKSYESLVYDIQKATNQSEIFRDAIKKIESETPNFTIDRGATTTADSIPKETTTSAESLDYNPKAMKAVFGNGAEEIKNWGDNLKEASANAGEAKKQISGVTQEVKQLQKSSSTLNNSETSSALGKLKEKLKEKVDPEIPVRVKLYMTPLDTVISKIENEVAALKSQIQSDMELGKFTNVDDEMLDLKTAEKTLRQYRSLANSLKGDIQGIKKETNSISTKKFEDFGNKLSGVKKKISKILHPLKTLKSLMKDSGESGGKSNGMSMGRMIGSSIMFSSIFGAISTIKQAVKEGSDNLVQYSSEYNNSISGMVSSLLYLKNAWAVAFAPIVNVVGPYISAFIDMMASALNKVGQFMAALTGKGTAVQAKKAWKDYGKTLSDTGSSAKQAGNDAKKAAKDFQTYTLGIDELNVQPQTTDSSSSGDSSSGSGSGGAYTGPAVSEMFEDVNVDDGIKSFADKLRTAFQNGDWETLGQTIGSKINECVDSVDFGAVGSKVGYGLNGAIQTAYYLLKEVNFINIGKKTADFLNNAIENIDFSYDGRLLVRGITSVFDLLGGFLGNLDYGNIAKSISDFILGAFDEATDWVYNVNWSNVGTTLMNSIIDFVTNIDYAGIVSSFFTFLGAAIAGTFNFVSGIVAALAPFAKAMEESFNGMGPNVIAGLLKGIGDAIASIGKWIWDNVALPFINGFRDAFGIHSPSTVMAEMGVYLIQGLVNGVVSVLQIVIDTFKNIWEGIKNIFSVLPTWFTTKFTEAYDGIKNAWAFVGTWAADKWDSVKKPFAVAKQWFTDKFLAAYNGIKAVWAYVGSWATEKYNSIIQPFKNVKKWFEEAFRSAYNAVKNIWNGIGGYFRGIANNIISPIGKAVNGVINGVNWVLGKVGSRTRLDNWSVPRFASGTNGLTQDTLGMVNDQKGNTYKELIVPPSGKPFIPEGRNVVLPMKKGTKIMPAGQTAELMSSMPKFAGGIGKFFGNAWDSITSFTGNVMDYISHPSKIMKMAIDKFTDTTGWDGVFGTIASSAVNKVFDSVVSYIKKIFDATGGGVEKAVKWAISIANDNSHGYDQANRWGNPDYDCSSLVISAFEQAGIKLKSAGATYTGNMYGAAKSVGFSDVTGSVNRGNGSGIKRGDILLNRENHVALAIGNGRLVQASMNENGGITGGRPGDQTGKEISTGGYYNYPWDDVLRYSKFRKGIGKIFPKDLPQFNDGGFPEDGLFAANRREIIGQFSNGKNVVTNNEQIVDGIAKGVYEAVVRAQSEDSREHQLLSDILDAIRAGKTISIDGRELVKVYDERKSRNGFAFT